MLTCWLSDQRSENLLCSMDSHSSLIRISLNEVPAYVCRSHSHHRFLVHVPSLYHAKARLGLNSASTVSSTWESSRLLEGPASLPWNLRPPNQYQCPSVSSAEEMFKAIELLLPSYTILSTPLQSSSRFPKCSQYAVDTNFFQGATVQQYTNSVE